MPRLLVVGDDRGVGRIVPDEYGVTIRLATVTLNTLLDGTRRNKARVLGEKLRRQSPPGRNVINDPDAATVCGQDKIVIARLERQITYRYRRKPATFELRPVLPAIDRNVEAKLRSEKKQIRLHDIFFNDQGEASNAFRILCCYKRRPCLPKISSTENVRSHIAKSVAIEGGVGSTRIVITRLHPAHP